LFLISGGLAPSFVPKGDILFENITFGYPSRAGKNILEKFDMNIEPGKSLAVVGGSGSGKTTIALLLLRLYEPDCGNIKVDGVNIKDYDPMWLRKHIGTVNQVN
jgi:ABC-type multidrug transport system fused ATPase/permease subunit